MAENMGGSSPLTEPGRRRWKFFTSDDTIGRRILKVSILLIFALSVLTPLSIYLYLTSPLRGGEIIRGVAASGIDLSCLTPDEARTRLQQLLPSLSKSVITARARSKQIQKSAADLGASWNVDGAIKEAMGIGRDSDIWGNLRTLGTVLRDGRRLQVSVNIDRTRILLALEPLSKAVTIKPHNARVHVTDPEPGLGDEGHIEVVPGDPGTKLDISGSAETIAPAIAASPGKPEITLELPLYHTTPQVTEQMLNKIEGIVGEYTTVFRPWMVGRTHNLWLASHAINGTVLMPGEVFSYNKTVGFRSIARGFRSAPIFVMGKVVEDTGGGVCQVATTTYDAALLSNLKIIERSPHSMRTTYSIPGRDATVSWDSLDLKFKNTRESPILITTAMGGDTLTVRMWGHKHPGEKVRVLVHDEPRAVVAYRVVQEPDGSSHTQVLSEDPYPKIPVE